MLVDNTQTDEFLCLWNFMINQDCPNHMRNNLYKYKILPYYYIDFIKRKNFSMIDIKNLLFLKEKR
jgi:hypothetical protein